METQRAMETTDQRNTTTSNARVARGRKNEWSYQNIGDTTGDNHKRTETFRGTRNERRGQKTSNYYSEGGTVNDEWKNNGWIVAGDVARTAITKPLFGIGKGIAMAGEGLGGAIGGGASAIGHGAYETWRTGSINQGFAQGVITGANVFEAVQGSLGQHITGFDDYLNGGNILSETSLSDIGMIGGIIGEQIGFSSSTAASRQQYFENKYNRVEKQGRRCKKTS